MPHFTMRAVGLWLGLVLAGCGGGGSGGSPQTSNEPPNTSNEPPTASDLCLPTDRDRPLSIVLDGSDAETPDNSLIYSVTQPEHGRVDAGNTAEVTYTPATDAPWGGDSFTYTVTDGDGASATGRVRVIVRPRIMPLGDSVTEGEYDQYNPDGTPADARAGYRKPLWDTLAREGYAVDFVGSTANGPTADFDRDNEGHPGIRTQAYSDSYVWNGDSDGVAEHIDAWLRENPADIVLLHIGINDFNTYKTADEVYAGTSQILANMNNWAAGEPSVGQIEVLLGQIAGADQPDPNRFTNAEVRRLDYELLPHLATQQITLVDQYAALKGSSDSEPDPALYANTLHPNQDGYDAMAATWAVALTRLLDQRGAKCP